MGTFGSNTHVTGMSATCRQHVADILGVLGVLESLVESCKGAARPVYLILCLMCCNCDDALDGTICTCPISVITSKNGVACVVLVCFGSSEVRTHEECRPLNDTKMEKQHENKVTDVADMGTFGSNTHVTGMSATCRQHVADISN